MAASQYFPVLIMRLKIPEGYLSGIKALSALSEDDTSVICDALSLIEPCFSPHALTSAVAVKSGLNREVTRDVIFVLVSLYLAWSEINLSLDEFIQTVVNAARDDMKIESAGLESLNQNLSVLLQLDRSVGVTARASDVMTTFDHVFDSTRVVSDLRTLFTTEPTDPQPLAAVITHTLKIEFYKDRKKQAFYVAMNSTDISKLKNTLERALNKEEQLESIAKKSGLPVLDSAPFDEDDL